jgi:uncharacterized protein
VRVVTLEEHVSFAAITERIDKAVIARRGFVPGASRPGGNPQPQLEDVGEGRLKLMDETGITVQVLSVSGPGAELLEGKAGVALARDYNDAICEKVRAHPTRLAAFAHLPMTVPHAAADELERAVEELGFCGALINGATNDRFLDDKQFAPILARAEQLAVPLYCIRLSATYFASRCNVKWSLAAYRCERLVTARYCQMRRHACPLSVVI